MNNQKKIVIAMDGFSSTGKSSISKAIAKKMGIIHMDTGALYRGITYFTIENYSKSDGTLDIEKLIENLEEIKLDFRKNIYNNELELYLNNQNINSEIRTQKVSDFVSLIAKQKEVRYHLLETQRNIAKNDSVILDGRDIGTIVFPNADFKFFLTADLDTRTKRRYKELKNSGYNVSKKEVLHNLQERDFIDSTREDAPLIKAKDAIEIDNSNKTFQETVDLILSIINKNDNL